MRLRLAKEEDSWTVAEFFKDLHGSSIYAKIIKYKPEDVADLVTRIARDSESGITLLLYDEEKLIGSMICTSMPQIFNKEEKTAVELAFWVKPESRSIASLKALLGAYKFWARKTGCTSILYGKLKDNSSVESYIVRKLS